MPLPTKATRWATAVALLAAMLIVAGAAPTPDVEAGRDVLIRSVAAEFCSEDGLGRATMRLTSRTDEPVYFMAEDPDGRRLMLGPETLDPGERRGVPLAVPRASDEVVLWLVEDLGLGDYGKISILDEAAVPTELACGDMDPRATFSQVDPETCTALVTIDNSRSSGPVLVGLYAISKKREVHLAAGASTSLRVGVPLSDVELPPTGEVVVWSEAGSLLGYPKALVGEHTYELACEETYRSLGSAGFVAPPLDVALLAATIKVPRVDPGCRELQGNGYGLGLEAVQPGLARWRASIVVRCGKHSGHRYEVTASTSDATSETSRRRKASDYVWKSLPPAFESPACPAGGRSRPPAKLMTSRISRCRTRRTNCHSHR